MHERRRRARRTTAALGIVTGVLAAGVLASCGDDPTGPASIEGRWTLRLVDGAPLPVLALESNRAGQNPGESGTLREYVTAGYLAAVEPEIDTLRVTVRSIFTPTGGTPQAPEEREVSLPLWISGDKLCPLPYGNPDGCALGIGIRRSGDTLSLVLSPLPPGESGDYAFVRVGR